MGYTDIDVVVDGALDETETIFDGDEPSVDDYIQARADATKLAPGQIMNIYVLYHDHPMIEHQGDCACVQYLTDHTPYLTLEG